MEQYLTPSKPSVHFEVQKVLGISADGTYQVQWAPAWVSKFHLVGCEHLIQEFLQRQAEKEVKLASDETRDIPHEYLQEESKIHKDSDESLQLEVPIAPINKTGTFNEFPDTPYQLEAIATNEVKIKVRADEVVYPSSNVEIDAQIEENPTQELEASTFNVEIKLEELEDPSTLEETASFIVGESSLLPYVDQEIDSNATEVEEHMAPALPEEEVNGGASTHTGSNSLKKHICEICHRGFRSTSHLRDHIATHTGVKRFACPVEHCTRTFIQKSNLKDHVRRLHPNGEASLQNIEPAVEDTGVVKKHACGICNKRFRNAGHLRDHLLLHTGMRPYSCEYCGKAFTQKCNLNKHLLVHTGEKPHICETCGKRFIQRSGLNYHMAKCKRNSQTDG